MLRRDQLKQAHPAVSSAVTAVLNSTPGGLSDAVCVNYFIDHHRSRFNAFRNSPALCDVPGPHTRGKPIRAVISETDSFVFGTEKS